VEFEASGGLRGNISAPPTKRIYLIEFQHDRCEVRQEPVKTLCEYWPLPSVRKDSRPPSIEHASLIMIRVGVHRPTIVAGWNSM